MGKVMLTTIVQEYDDEGLRTLSINEMITRELPSKPVYDDTERAKLRKAILKDLGRCVDMLLTGQGDRITIERDAR